MRVLLLTTDAYGGHGGIALYNRDVVDALVTMPEVDQVVVVPRNMPFPPDGVPDRAVFLSDAVGSKMRYVKTAFSVAPSRFDLVICGHINLLPIAALMNLLIRAPLVLMVYGIEVWMPPYKLARQWLAGVDAVWSISAITRDRMNDWSKLPESTFSLLPNAIHLERYGSAEKRQDLLKLHALEGCKVIMTLARLLSTERYKGVDEVMELMPSLIEREPTLKYLVVGDGDDRPRLEEKSRALGLDGRVVFAGLIKESDKADYFRLSDAFVMPGRGEGFGFVFLEALACGVPAVGSKLDGSREALLGGQLGELADPSDFVSVRDAILSSLAKPKAIQPALNYFAWPAFVDRLINATRQVVASNRN